MTPAFSNSSVNKDAGPGYVLAGDGSAEYSSQADNRHMSSSLQLQPLSKEITNIVADILNESDDDHSEHIHEAKHIPPSTQVAGVLDSRASSKSDPPLHAMMSPGKESTASSKSSPQSHKHSRDWNRAKDRLDRLWSFHHHHPTDVPDHKYLQVEEKKGEAEEVAKDDSDAGSDWDNLQKSYRSKARSRGDVEDLDGLEGDDQLMDGDTISAAGEEGVEYCIEEEGEQDAEEDEEEDEEEEEHHDEGDSVEGESPGASPPGEGEAMRVDSDPQSASDASSALGLEQEGAKVARLFRGGGSGSLSSLTRSIRSINSDAATFGPGQSRRHPWTSRADGGINGRNAHGRTFHIYYVGIIDILQQYNSVKRVENLIKVIKLI